MKINDIILEKNQKFDAHDQRAIKAGANPNDPYEIEAYKKLYEPGGGPVQGAPTGLHWKTLAMKARSHWRYGASSKAASPDRALDALLHGYSDQPPDPKQPTSNQDDSTRSRRDRQGRKLKHDRYYRDKDKDEKPSRINPDDLRVLPPDHFDVIPGVKTLRKKVIPGVKKTANIAKHNFKKGKDVFNFKK
jgi:hypothetical protein